MPSSKLETASAEKPKAFKDLLERPGVISAVEVVPPPYGTSEEETKQHIERISHEFGSLISSIDVILYPDLDPKEMGQDGTKKDFRVESIDSAEYAKLVRDNGVSAIPIPFRRSARVQIAQMDEQLAWVQSTYDAGLSNLVIVGGDMRVPDYDDLLKPYQIVEAVQKSSLPDLIIGGISIPTRGRRPREGEPFTYNENLEPAGLYQKQTTGMRFHPTQLIGENKNLIDVLGRYWTICEEHDVRPNPLIIGLTIMGNKRSAAFLEWLGVYFPEDDKRKISNHPKGMMEGSIEHSLDIYRDILEFAFKRNPEATIGFYVGGTAPKNIAASVEQFGRLEELAKQYSPS